MNTDNRYQETDLGNVSPNPRGEYKPRTEYEYLDLVTFDGGSYICLAEPGTTTTESPESGKNTKFWQCMTIPGDMTPEYVAMHDRVVNLSEQVEADAEEVRTAEQNVSGMELNVTKMQEQTRQSAESAEQSKDSAAGYAASADTSRRAAETSEQNINAQVTGFDAHVAEKTSESEQSIEASRIAANKAILAQQEQSVGEVARVGGAAVSEAQAAAHAATEKASAASESEKNAKASETATKNSETNVTRMAEQVTKDKEQVSSDRTAVEEAKQEMTEKAEQIGQNTQDVAVLKKNVKELNDKKITKFYASNLGNTTLNDSDNGNIADMMLYGKSFQQTYTGKNLLNTSVSTKTVNGVTIKKNDTDGTFTLNGTATSDITFDLNDFRLEKEPYQFKSFKIHGSYSGNVFPLCLDDSWGNQMNSKIDGDAVTLSTYNTYNHWRIAVRSGSVCNNLTIGIMVGNDLTDYEPYVGGIPSPNPDYPQEIQSVVNPVVTVTDADGTNSKTATLPYTLNAIPVSEGGNVTIDGQQYIADYVDVENKKLVRKIKEVKVSETVFYQGLLDSQGTIVTPELNLLFPPNNASIGIAMCTFLKLLPLYINVTEGVDVIGTDKSFGFRGSGEKRIEIRFDEYVNDIDKFKSDFANEKFLFVLETPTTIDLTDSEVQAFKELLTYYPTTNVFVTSDQLDGYTTFNYPLNMKNGWDYVKEQLGDTREYIYDMELQSMEAYVNSEYAVTLAELEV